MAPDAGALVPALRALEAELRADALREDAWSRIGEKLRLCADKLAALLHAAETPPEVAASESQGEGDTTPLMPLPGAAAIPSPPSPETAAIPVTHDWNAHMDTVKAALDGKVKPEQEPETAAETLIAEWLREADKTLSGMRKHVFKRCADELAPLVARWRDDLRIAHNQVAALLEQREHSEATCARLEAERDNYRTLAGIGVWHTTCRPNREMAARELQKSQAVIDKLADTITRLEADLAAVREALPKTLPAGRKHYVGGSETRTACGRQRNKLSRGGSAYEWAYVTCPDCLATRAAAPSAPQPCSGMAIGDGNGQGGDGVIYPGDPTHCPACASAPQGEEKKP